MMERYSNSISCREQNEFVQPVRLFSLRPEARRLRLFLAFLLWYRSDMPAARICFLGVDGGGSKCRARIRDQEGMLLGEAVGGASNVYQNFEGSIANIVLAANEAAEKARVDVQRLHAGLGLAGIVTSIGTERVEQAGLPFASVTVDNDAYAACVGAFSGERGGIVIAGTGSIGLAIVGRERHMVGGWGFQLGDHGSGAWLGHHAVRRAAWRLMVCCNPRSSSKRY
jgi:glucosamine kinase